VLVWFGSLHVQIQQELCLLKAPADWQVLSRVDFSNIQSLKVWHLILQSVTIPLENLAAI
jgi:hypothetical protein